MSFSPKFSAGFGQPIVNNMLAAVTAHQTDALAWADDSVSPLCSYPSAYAIGVAPGNVVLYTVPSGRKAFLFDLMVTNPTAGAIVYYPALKIGATYYQLGNPVSEAAAGIGHNYGFNNARSCGSIVLNAGESIAINSDAAGLSVWPNIVEFDADGTTVARADIRTWSAGYNTLLTVPEDKTISIGGLNAGTSVNNPGISASGVTYRNNSGSSRTLSGAYWVPSGGSPSSANQVIGSNSVTDQTGFTKLLYGNVEPGASLVLAVDAGTATQFAWMNYVLR